MAWFGETRSVKEQMLGVEAALARAPGKSVIDLGAAECHISARFAAAGAKFVCAYDCNAGFIETGKRLFAGMDIHFAVTDIEEWAQAEYASGQELRRYDIVLALAILHKMHDVTRMAKFFARLTGELLVIRLPRGCKDGVVHSKHQPGAKCDLPKVMYEMGLRRTADYPGPRGERVWYFERVA